MEQINLVPTILAAQAGNEEAMVELLFRFDPICIRQAKYGRKTFDEDCYQELHLHLIKVIRNFDVEKFKNK
ncbi:hypothetical protein FC84_GL000280 [Lapidilactobacillus dextrinicus DSM 20335]|uniref:Helix-turn-helix conjugative transposon-like domain-containing protein n=1 Tax=Lapidilactobacillus dextrinicus DSM 20335 TaxID=1423738 RepID=A0A0R2BJV3_9LACO|nr:helix-turn-helix domain-containing protein [Lapidilactobacillus dextrinicus]KRM78802.1 hypothetical protein FC84_GL000280 [Lapidilactobacillus dextrinicus DSM 20335]QFG46501.1 helix-turn-helix domain-containing protein [Lapidilactobacillus dextrinicus]